MFNEKFLGIGIHSSGSKKKGSSKRMHPIIGSKGGTTVSLR
jgi:hypothetical protein